MSQTDTIDPAEVAKFEAMAAEWWDTEGKFKPLHLMNPCRLDYITAQIAAEFDRDLTQAVPLKGLRILDIGCGGGCCRNRWRDWGRMWWGRMRRRGTFRWRRFMRCTSGLVIDYRHTTAEDLAASGEQFDVVLNMEVVWSMSPIRRAI